MTDIREQILSNYIRNIGIKTTILPQNHPARNCGHTTLPNKVVMFDKSSVLEAMDDYALKVLTHARLSWGFSDIYLSDLKQYLEEIKTKLK